MDCCPDPIVPGTAGFIAAASKTFRVAVYSSRSGQPGGLEAMRAYLRRALRDDALFEQIEWPTEKPAALVTIDDRAMQFTGDWADFDPGVLRAFQPWNKRPPAESGLSGAQRSELSRSAPDDPSSFPQEQGGMK